MTDKSTLKEKIEKFAEENSEDPEFVATGYSLDVAVECIKRAKEQGKDVDDVTDRINLVTYGKWDSAELTLKDLARIAILLDAEWEIRLK